MNTAYNATGVHTVTPKDDQFIFMSADFNAQFDVNVLASSFNFERADFMGRLALIDDFTTFDNDRFSEIMAGSDQIELVTDEELSLMSDVIGVLVDREWFQVYDNNAKFTEKYVASGMYWNYFYNIWKTVSVSPFSNAIVFVKNTADTAAPETLTFTVASKDVNDDKAVFTLEEEAGDPSVAHSVVNFVQTRAATTAGIAIHKYGAVIMPATGGTVTLVATLDGVTYTAAAALTSATAVGTDITFNKE
jgi:hypothetical protein